MIVKFKSNVRNMGSFAVKYNFSAMSESPGFYGASHLIEHCMCEPIKAFENELFINGLSYNAFTSIKNVVFHIQGIDKSVKDFRVRFYNEVVNYQITEEDFNRQKEIVIQELKNYQSDQYSVFDQNIKRKYFNAPDVGGEIDDLEKLTYDKFMFYKNTYFNIPDEIILTSKYDLTEEENNILKTNNRLLINKKYTFNKDGYDKFKLIDGPKVDENRIVSYIVPFKSFKADNFEKLIYYNLFRTYINFGLTSPLYHELRDVNRYVYGVSSDTHEIDETTFTWITTLQTCNEHLEDSKRVMMEVFEREIKNPSRERYNSSVKILKNNVKKAKYTTYFRTNTFMQNIYFDMDKFKFNFRTFKKYIKEFYDSEYILTDDLKIKE